MGPGRNLQVFLGEALGALGGSMTSRGHRAGLGSVQTAKTIYVPIARGFSRFLKGQTLSKEIRDHFVRGLSLRVRLGR